MSFLYESIISVKFENVFVRVWIDQEKNDRGMNHCNPENLYKLLGRLVFDSVDKIHGYNHYQLNDIADTILKKYSQINAIEIKEGDQGVVVYRDWT